MSDASSMQIGDDTSWANYAHTILELPDEPVLRLGVLMRYVHYGPVQTSRMTPWRVR